MKTAIIFVCLLTISYFPQEKIKRPLLYLSDKTSYKLDKNNFSLPVWIAASETTVSSVHVEIPNIISSDGRVKVINYKIEPDTAGISVSTIGRLFKIKFDSLEIDDLDSGKYSLTMIISGANTEPVKETLSFEIAPVKSAFVWLEEGVNWILNNFFVLLWNLLQAILIIFVFIFILKLIYSILKIKKKNSLNVLPFVNETGKEDECKGAAEGIDDILIYRLQEISRLSSEEVLEKYRLSGITEAHVEKENVQRLNVVGGEFSMDLQQIGDITIGPIKIPLGSISGLLLKLFGGNFVSGSLQKYGMHNKLFIKLEKKLSVLAFSKREANIPSVQYFEASWTTNTVNSVNITEGIPDVVDELAYKLILELSKDVGTHNWRAYKYFLDGYKLFNDFEKNRTRIDILRDSITLWRESVKADPDFAKAHYNLGVAYDMDGNIEDAIFHYQKAISLKPNLIGAEAHFNLARLFWEKYRDENRTLSELEKAKRIDPEISDIYNLEGLVYSNKPNNYNKESELYQIAIKKSLKNPIPVFYYNLCVANYYLNKLAEAQSAGEQAYNLYGEKDKLSGLLLTMGLIHFQKGINFEKSNANDYACAEFEKSAKYYAEGLLKNPENRDLLKGYRDVLFKLGRIKDGMEILKRLIRLYPVEPICYIGISEYLRAAKVPADEIDIYEQIATILQGEQDPLKLGEAFQKEDGSLLQWKLFKGILASIFYVLYDPQRYPQFLNDSLTIFKEIFQPRFDNVLSMIDGELLYNYGKVLVGFKYYRESLNIFKKEIKIYENNESIFDLAQANIALANGYTNLIISNYSEYQKYDRKLKNLQEDERVDKSDEVEKEKMDATKKCHELLVEAQEVSPQADLAFQNASYYYEKSGFFSLAISAHLENARFLMKEEVSGFFDNAYINAEEECNRAIRIDEKDADAFHLKGNAFYYLRQYTKAIPEYEKSVALNFNLSGSQYGIGLCYFELGDYEMASKAFQTAIKLNPKYTFPDDMTTADAYQRLAMSLDKLGDIRGAVKILSDAINIHPYKVKYSILLGRMLKKENDLESAAREFRISLSLDPQNLQKMSHIPLIELADIYADHGADIDSVINFINEAKMIIKQGDAINRDEEIYKIMNTEGWILFKKNQFEPAIKLLEKTLSYFLNEPKYHTRLAYAYEKYANSLSDVKLKEEYLSTSVTQWQIVSNLKGNEFYKIIADEHLAKLNKV